MAPTLKAVFKNGFNAAMRALNAGKRPDPSTNRRLLQERGESISDFVIREATVADIPALAELHAKTWAETYPSVSHPPAAQLREHQWRGQFASRGDQTWFLLLMQNPRGELVGFAKGQPYSHADLPMYDGEINKIYLLRDYQRLGLGRRLFCETVSRFLDRDITSAVLFGTAENPSGAFHEAMGGRRLYAKNGEFHGGYGWPNLRSAAGLCDPTSSTHIHANRNEPA